MNYVTLFLLGREVTAFLLHYIYDIVLAAHECTLSRASPRSSGPVAPRRGAS